MKITHIDQVLPHVKGRPDFVIAEKEGYTVIDYRFVEKDSFDHPIRRECRGIKFAPDGRIMARPLQKFFNIGERPETMPGGIDWSQPHVVSNKLDGSMIHTAIVGDKIVFMTRMGVTDIAQRAFDFAAKRSGFPFCQYVKAAHQAGWTLIFEYTAPDNRIVIQYDKPALTLIACRDTLTGRHKSAHFIDEMSKILGIPNPHRPEHRVTDWRSFIDQARALVGEEGYVVRFDDDFMVKIKGDDYVLKHKTKEQAAQERNIIALILSGKLDDVLPLLVPDNAKAMEEFRDLVLHQINETAIAIKVLVNSTAGYDRKTFATDHASKLAPALRSIAFMVRDGADPVETVRKVLLKATGSTARLDAHRILIGGARWDTFNGPA